MVSLLKRVLIGRPIATAEEGHQRLRKRVALPIFASDAMSSTAYATDEILIVLLIQAGAGAVAFDKLVPLAIIVAALLFIVILSYRQTIYAYPSGGGAYIVSKRNLGEIPALVAGASLLTDYILTVAVSVAGGVLAMQSAFGFGSSVRVPMCLGIIAVLTVANLRGLRESGTLFAPPTYLYVVMLAVLIGVGLYRVVRPRPRTDPARRPVGGGPRTGRRHQDVESVHAPAGVLVRRRRPVRCGGGLQRGADVPAAGEPQCRDDAGDHGCHPGHRVRRDLAARIEAAAVPR